MKRIFLIVLDSFGIGEMPDASRFHDEGSNTLAACSKSKYFNLPNMKKLGLFNIDGVDCCEGIVNPTGSYARLSEASDGKDTTIGHWEIAGIVSKKAFPTYPNGFPEDILNEFSKRTGLGVICNKPYSGTKVIEDYGVEHLETGNLIIYTSADSVFQIAAHEDIVPVEQLYKYCEIARELLNGENAVARVIARPFAGMPGSFVRTPRRHDFSLVPPKPTMCNAISSAGMDVLGVGKINDIFAGSGITETIRTNGNAEGIEQTLNILKKSFDGLCFVNLVDFDMLYGHRNDVPGYAKALSYFDNFIPDIISGLENDDILMITADHGCDPYTKSTDHSREYIPLLIYGSNIESGVDLGTRNTFADIAATICEYFDVDLKTEGKSFLGTITKK